MNYVHSYQHLITQSHNNVTITAATHVEHKTNDHVIDLYIKETKTTFIPDGLEKISKSLKQT